MVVFLEREAYGHWFLVSTQKKTRWPQQIYVNILSANYAQRLLFLIFSLMLMILKSNVNATILQFDSQMLQPK
jgi:sensor domain CHASE-containing protein